jgi:RHS repeat-associated protein
MKSFRFVAVALGLVLVGQSVSPAVAAEVTPRFFASDFLSAKVEASYTGHRILLIPELSAMSTTWVNPDGTLTTDSFGSAVRVRDESGLFGWRDLDYSLDFDASGNVVAKSGLWPIVLSGGGSSELVSLTSASGKVFGFDWQRVLPKPLLEGDTARYVDVLPNVDLLVRVDSGGFEQSFELKAAPSPEVINRLTLLVAGDSVSIRSDGSGYSFESQGKHLASVVEPTVFDAQGLPVADAVTFSNSSQKLSMVLSSRVFSDSSLDYPVIVDPAVVLNPSFDTYTSSDTPTTTYDTASDLWIGGFDGGTSIYRSYLNFDSVSWQGQDVVSANLNLFLNWSSSCAPKYFSIFNTLPASSSTTWSNAPAFAGTGVSRLVAAGYNSSCPASYVISDVTSLVRAVAPSVMGTAGFGLRASNELDVAAQKSFNSSNANTNKPFLSVTYNRAPSVADMPTVSDAVSVSGVLAAGSLKPMLSSRASDPDGNDITYQFKSYSDSNSLTPIATLCSVTAASGSSASCRPTGALMDGQTYFVRAMSSDGRVTANAVSAAVSFKVSATAPATPTVTCPYVNGFQGGAVPDVDFTCVVSTPATSALNKTAIVSIILDEGNPQIVQANTDGSSRTSVTIPGGAFQQRLSVVSQTISGIQSSQVNFVMSFGVVGVINPLKHETLSDYVALSGYGVSVSGVSATSVGIQWRNSGSSGAWNSVVNNVGVVSNNGVKALYNYKVNLKSLVDLDGLALSQDTPSDINFRMCFNYSTIAEVLCSDDAAISVTYWPNSLDGVTSDAGPGSVSLVSGRYSMAVDDFSQQIGLNSLSVSRTYIQGGSAAGTSSSIFGPGWISSLSSNASSVAHFKLSSDSANNHFYLGDETNQFVFYGKSGLLSPVTDASIESQLKLFLAGATLTITDQSNTTSTFTKGSAGSWLLQCIRGSASARAVLTAYDSAGFMTDSGYGPSNSVGCASSGITHGLHFSYVAVNGLRLLSGVSYIYVDQSSGLSMSVPELSYAYSSTGLLLQANNLANGSTTDYEYNSASEISKVSFSGLAPYQFKYDTLGRLVQIQRSQSWLWLTNTSIEKSFIYDQPVSGNAGYMPDLSASLAAHWGQLASDMPAYSVAIFGADTNINLNVSGSSLAPAATDAIWRNAQITYLDAKGRVSNSANYGKGQWLYTANLFNSNDSIREVFDNQGILEVLDRFNAEGNDNFDEAMYSTYTTYLNVIQGRSVPGGFYVSDTWSPIHSVWDSSGTKTLVRSHYNYRYDEGAPTSDLYGLVTNVRAGLTYGASLSVTDSQTLSSTANIYDPQDGSSANGPTSGWALRAPTWVKTFNGYGEIAKQSKTFFNRLGQRTKVVANGSNGADSRSTLTTYYSASANAAHPECGLNESWQDLICVVETAEAVPVESSYIANYDNFLRPTLAKQYRLGNLARTVQTSYLPDSRIDSTTVTGLSGSSITTQHVYDSDSLLETKTQLFYTGVLQSETQSSFDAWGRQISSTNSLGEQTTTSYVSPGLIGAGEISSVSNSKFTSTYTYGSTSESRNLVTGLTIAAANSAFTYAYYGTYDQLGRLVTQSGPNNMSQNFAFNDSGAIESMSYSTPNTTTAQTLLTWTRYYDGFGRVIKEQTPNPLSFSLSPEKSSIYAYDSSSRLASATTTTPSSCFSESYSYDDQGDRTNSLVGSCIQPTASAHTFNSEAQLQNAGYVYDRLGRNTYIPAADAPNNGTSISLTYNNVDQVTNISQGANSTSYTYDALGRRVNELNNGVNTVRHYTDSSDNPDWTTQQDATSNTTELYTRSLANGLAITTNIKSTVKTATMQLNDLQGNTVATLNLDTNTTSPWQSYDSFGSQLSNQSNLNLINYSAYGQQQRATSPTGLILMGARVYNPKTNQFTSIDPIPNGNENNYTYPNDPLNQSDFNGMQSMDWFQMIVLSTILYGLGILVAEATCIGIPQCAAPLAVASSVVANLITQGIDLAVGPASTQTNRAFNWADLGIAAFTGMIGGSLMRGLLRSPVIAMLNRVPVIRRVLQWYVDSVLEGAVRFVWEIIGSNQRQSASVAQKRSFGRMGIRT